MHSLTTVSGILIFSFLFSLQILAFSWSDMVSLAMAAEKLKDLSQPIDVPLLDATVAAFYGTRSKEEVPFPVSSSFYFFLFC